MTWVNTTTGAKWVDEPPARHVNTSRVVEEDLKYIDEPEDVEVLNTVPADSWAAVLEGEDGQLRVAPLVCWSRVRLGEGELLYGIVPDGNVVDPTEDVGDREDFRSYVKLGDTELGHEVIEELLEKQVVETKEEDNG